MLFEDSYTRAAERTSAVQSVLVQLRRHHRATAEHSFRVGFLARILADELGVNTEEIAEIERVALVHDVGKLVSVPGFWISLGRSVTSSANSFTGTRTQAAC